MKRGTQRHPKFSYLRELLKTSVPATVGLLELTWHFTQEYAPQGNVGRFDDARIEAAACWSGKRGRLVEALTLSGWLDADPEHRLLVHDWADHADGAVKKRLERAGLSFLTATPKTSGQRLTSADNGALARARSLPTPLPALPIPASPTPEPAEHEQQEQRVCEPKFTPWTGENLEAAMQLLRENRPVMSGPLDIATTQRITENMLDIADLGLFFEITSLSKANDWGMVVVESRKWPAIRPIAQKQKQAKEADAARRCQHDKHPDDCWDCQQEETYARQRREDAERRAS